jgi:diadenosine tetraphosphate (Ap4A) HIT family hydrolase
MTTPVWLSDPVGYSERGENPTVIARMASGFVVIGLAQFLPGYCLLLASPKVPRLEDMPRQRRVQFLDDMGLLGEAIARACEPRRVNHSIYGNTDTYVHAHVIPRYDWETPERVARPPWDYPRTMWSDPEHTYDETKHGALKTRIAAELRRLTA